MSRYLILQYFFMASITYFLGDLIPAISDADFLAIVPFPTSSSAFKDCTTLAM